jgi:hypothetical protein
MPSPETSNLELGGYLGFKINHKIELKSQHLTRDINDVYLSQWFSIHKNSQEILVVNLRVS